MESPLDGMQCKRAGFLHKYESTAADLHFVESFILINGYSYDS